MFGKWVRYAFNFGLTSQNFQMGLFGMIILMVYYFTESLVIEEVPESLTKKTSSSNAKRVTFEHISSAYDGISTQNEAT